MTEFKPMGGGQWFIKLESGEDVEYQKPIKRKRKVVKFEVVTPEVTLADTEVYYATSDEYK